MMVYGPHASDSVITVCPDLDYMVVFECSVVDSVALLWRGSPLLNTNVQITSSNFLGQKFMQTHATVILTEITTTIDDLGNSFKSQLQVHSSVLSEMVPLNVTCLASSTRKKTISAVRGKA